MAPAYDVVPADLTTGGGALAQDAATLSGGCGSAVEQARVAAGGVNGGALAGALAAFAGELADRGATVVAAIEGAGETLTSNAHRYVGDDQSAHQSLMKAIPQ